MARKYNSMFLPGNHAGGRIVVETASTDEQIVGSIKRINARTRREKREAKEAERRANITLPSFDSLKKLLED